MDKILNLLEENATLTAKQIAVMLEKEEGDIIIPKNKLL